MNTAAFTFVIGLNSTEAPHSTAYFLADVAAGRLAGSSVFRIVNLFNQPKDHPSKIEVIQMGLRETNPAIAPSLQHESTGTTRLRHQRGTVSLARFAPGAVYHSFFVCMRDEPALDEGGSRHPDGLGFAAFGFVEEGFDGLEEFYAQHSKSQEYPTEPVLLRSVTRRGG